MITLSLLVRRSLVAARRGGLAVLVLCLTAWAGRAQIIVHDFSDIQYWVGSGSNEAALVIDWSDGTTDHAYAWGYRWNGTASAFDMLQAIAGTAQATPGTAQPGAGADPNLVWGAVAGFPTAVFGIGYAPRGTQFGFTFGFAAPGQETGSATYAGEHYEEGWYDNGYWGEWVNATAASPYTTGSWTFAENGLADTNLTNGFWEGLSFDPDFADGFEPGLAYAALGIVPEPGSIALLVLGAAVLFRRRWRGEEC